MMVSADSKVDSTKDIVTRTIRLGASEIILLSIFVDAESKREFEAPFKAPEEPGVQLGENHYDGTRLDNANLKLGWCIVCCPSHLVVDPS
jgi:hypothetical protein